MNQCMVDSAPICPYEAERRREEAENNFYMPASTGSPMLGLDIDHPTLNPPMYFPDTILPPDP